MLSGDNSILQKATDAKARTDIAQEEESANLTFTEVQMELTQGNEVNSDSFQKMIDGNFGNNKATGTIGGGNYIITVADSGNIYSMDTTGKISKLDNIPIDFEAGVLEKEGNTYTINSIEDLVAFSYNVNSGIELYEGKTVVLGRNLDFNQNTSYADVTTKYLLDEYGYKKDSSGLVLQELLTNNVNKGFVCIGNGKKGSFNGTFDGSNHSISNLFMNSDNFGGLFGSVRSNIKILNLKIISCNIEAQNQSGSLVGAGQDITIYNCSSSGTISSQVNSAGLVGGYGTSTHVNIYNSYNYCNITSGTISGGIVATCSGIINNCYNNGTINSTGEFSSGGIIGYGSPTITNCYNLGQVEGKATRESLTGGIAGRLEGGTASKCFNKGTIKTSANVPVGGIVGLGGTITYSHNTGNIFGLQSAIVGEIIGAGSVNSTNDFLEKENNANANGATSKTQSEMDETMSIQNFVNLMNSYVSENNADSTKTKLKTWKVENGLPVFAD